jgi:hypothetical protein
LWLIAAFTSYVCLSVPWQKHQTYGKSSVAVSISRLKLAHTKVTFHFTPTSVSWLSQVEIWFGIFQRKALSNASFGSIKQLTTAIHDFAIAYNANAAPFVWRKREAKGAQLSNTIVNLRN